MSLNEHAVEIFERLLKGETATPQDPQIHRLQEPSYATKQLLVNMNNSSNPSEIRSILDEITGSIIHESTSVFTPSLPMEKHKNRKKRFYQFQLHSFGFGRNHY